MPYSEYAIENRKEVAKFKWQIRHFQKKIADVPADRRAKVEEAIQALMKSLDNVMDFSDDGVLIGDSYSYCGEQND